MVRRVLLTLALMVSGLGSFSCIGPDGAWMKPHRCMETLGETGDEHEHRVERVLEQDRRALAEDLDLWFLTDRPSRLTRWHSR